MSRKATLIPLALALLAPAAFGQDDKPGDLPNKAGWHVEPDPGETFKPPF